MRLTADGVALGSEDFSALMAPFGPFESGPVVAVGVSGGRDSLCLALLAHDWAKSRGGRAISFIVDHGLRAEAQAEARLTRDLLVQRGIEAEVLSWMGAKPRGGIQNAARIARYRLINDACRARGILHLLVAHHADDQAETVAMRASRASGPDGLAGIAALVEQRHVRLIRPLLAVSRNRITATLQARGVSWIEDPSNADPRFERARLRAAGAPASPGAERGRERRARERELAGVSVAALEFGEDGEVGIDRTALGRLSEMARCQLLSRVVQAVGGRDYPPRRDRLARAAGRLLQAESRGKSGKSQDFTLSECRLMLRRASPERRLRWIVRPENGTKCSKESRQPLVPAGFFPCDAGGAPHLDSQPLAGSKTREPVQS